MSLDIWLAIPMGNGEELRSEGLNYTHNVTPMWKKAGVYEALYKSDRVEAWRTNLVLESGIGAMLCDPDGFRALNPSNGWGDYEGALAFLRAWADMCRKHPRALIRIWA